MVTSGIREEERVLVMTAIEECKNFDEIMRTSIIFDDKYREKTCRQSDRERLKHRLMLCAAWEIAIADNIIEQSELQLHNRMADKLGISRSEVEEIRRSLDLKHGRKLREVVEILEPNGSKTKLLKNVRDRYRLLPASDCL
jgi:DnaJ-domain-containing protein 1